MTHTSEYFYGHKISDYGLEHHRVDYRTLAQAFDAVMCNDIISRTDGVIGYWEQESGFIDNSEEIEELEEKAEEIRDQIAYDEDENDGANVESLEDDLWEIERKIEELQSEQDEQPEIFQYYIVSDNAEEILKEANEIIFYNDELDIYVWGVTHWGTAWDYVLTNIIVDLDKEG